MKRLILSLLALGCITLAQAQQKTTLAECNGDTVAYLKKNFVEGKQRFIGQPVSLILDEWRSQLPVGKLIFSDTGWKRDTSKAELINGIALYFITNEELGLRDMQKKPYTILNISLAPPYHDNIWDIYHLQDSENETLGPKLYDRIKDYIVTDVSDFEMRRQ
ncbi:hypothetical protein [Millionella massiliensis]|uniref:hypothetical protein n=1 Tax=Millionella massiliensis TaxID=1871023 RepID=UPI0008DAAF44|nr:hypothetical protein [Millionella massiliensis]